MSSFLTFINIKFYGTLIPVPKTSLILIMSCPMRGRFLEAILKWAERAGTGKPGPADRLVAKVERREAPRPTSLGARGRLAARGGYVNPASEGATLLHPGASRRSTPAGAVRRRTGKARTHCAARMRALGCLNPWIRNSRRSAFLTSPRSFTGRGRREAPGEGRGEPRNQGPVGSEGLRRFNAIGRPESR
jgi:hypothetical protein